MLVPAPRPPARRFSLPPQALRDEQLRHAAIASAWAARNAHATWCACKDCASTDRFIAVNSLAIWYLQLQEPPL